MQRKSNTFAMTGIYIFVYITFRLCLMKMYCTAGEKIRIVWSEPSIFAYTI